MHLVRSAHLSPQAQPPVAILASWHNGLPKDPRQSINHLLTNAPFSLKFSHHLLAFHMHHMYYHHHGLSHSIAYSISNAIDNYLKPHNADAGTHLTL